MLGKIQLGEKFVDVRCLERHMESRMFLFLLHDKITRGGITTREIVIRLQSRAAAALRKCNAGLQTDDEGGDR